MPSISLTSDLLFQGLAALFLLLWAGRDAWKARRETLKAVAPNPVVAAVSMAWDRNQQERLIQLVERMTIAMETQAKAQGAMAETESRKLNDHIEELLDRLKDAPETVPRRRR